MRASQKSERRQVLERQLAARMYHFEDASIEALRLVGAATEAFFPAEVTTVFTSEPYQLPLKYREQHSALLDTLIAEARANNKAIFNGAAVRMPRFQVIPGGGEAEQKSLRLTFGPLPYFDHAIVWQLTNTAMEDGGGDTIEDFVDLDQLCAQQDLSASSLSNIVDTATTIVTQDGYILFSEVGASGWHTCAIAEAINETADKLDFNSSAELTGVPFRTVARGIEKRISPQLNELLDSIGWEGHLRMLGISYDLAAFHPSLLFALFLPLSYAELEEIAQPLAERGLRALDTSEGTGPIVTQLVTQRWRGGGGASIARTLEYLTSMKEQQGCDSIRGTVAWILQR